MHGERAPDTTTQDSRSAGEGQDAGARRGVGAGARIAAFLVALSSTLLSLGSAFEVFGDGPASSNNLWESPYPLLLVMLLTLLPVAAFALITLKQRRMRRLEERLSRSIDDFDDALLQIAVQAVTDRPEVRRRLTHPETQ